MSTVLLVLLSFLSGSLPFSYWLGRLALRRDIRTVGDQNPGATNVLLAGGPGWGGLALVLDIAKGALPVAWSHLVLGSSELTLIGISVAAVLGHAFSPFLGFRGGKAVAVTCGVWAGLTLWEGPTVGGIVLLLAHGLTPVGGWAVVTAMVGMALYFVWTPPSWNGLIQRPDLTGVLLPIWTLNFLILLWKHREDLRRLPGIRTWIRSWHSW